jgi:hypothetical protein
MSDKNNLLQEVIYTVPPEKGVRAFWDFYACYMLWYRLGSGFTDYFGKGKYHPGQISNEKKTEYIDSLAEQCIRPIAKGIVEYLKQVSILEFSYLDSESNFGDFFHSLDDTDNKEDLKADKDIYLPHIGWDLVLKFLKYVSMRSGEYSNIDVVKKFLKESYDDSEWGDTSESYKTEAEYLRKAGLSLHDVYVGYMNIEVGRKD